MDNIPEGYKQTEVGVIPEEWEVKTIGELTTLLTNGFVGKVTDHYTDSDDGVLYIQGFNVEENSFNFFGIKRVTLEFHKQHTKSYLLEGDLLTIQTGDIGVTTVIPKELEGSNCHALIISRFKKGHAIPKFFSYYFNSFYGRNRLKDIETGSTMKHLNVGDMIKWLIPCPPLPEQQSIASALSDVDALITVLDQLITKKRNIKQGAMQQLLTGKKRLPGFSGEWEVKTLGELGSFSKGKGIRKDEVVSEGLPCIRYGEIYTTHNDYIKSFKSFITQSIANESIEIEKGDLLFAGSGETAEEIGKCVAFVGNERVFAGGDIVILRPSINNNSLFLGFLLNDPIVSRQKARKGQGDAVVHISGKNLSEIQIPLPPTKAEQTAIAQILSDMDTEIEALEQKRDKYKALKQGMMQELLTGKTRLV